MDRLIFQDKETMDRIQLLEANCDDMIDSYPYDRILSEEEVADEEHNFAQTNIKIARLEWEKKVAVEEWNLKIKAEKKIADVAIAKIKTGREEACERVYVLRSDDGSTEGYYNHRGELVRENALRKGGRQYAMKMIEEPISKAV